MLKEIPNRIEIVYSRLDKKSLKELSLFNEVAYEVFSDNIEYKIKNLSDLNQVSYLRAILKYKGYIVTYSSDKDLYISFI